MAEGSGIRRILLIVVFSLPLLFVIAALGFWFGFDSSFGIQGENGIEFVVNKGDNFTTVSRRLEDLGLVSSSQYVLWRYKIMQRIGLDGALQAGRYNLESGSRPSELIGALTNGSAANRVYTKLTIPPGLSSRAIARRVQESGLSNEEYVRDAIIRLASDYPIKSTDEGLQGYLFPDTYNIETPLDNSEESLRVAADELIIQMAEEFFETLDEIDPSWINLTKNQLHEKVTLASIIEREYRVASEAAMISAVFKNRLDSAMPLQSCATVVYVIEDTEVGAPYLNRYLRQNRRIFEEYLDIPSPYNTYNNKSQLPPGPIAISGRVALEAAFFPADTDALFFVVKDPVAGTHTFTRRYSDHLSARDAYLNQFVVKE